jgi:hypothetical protein
MTQTEIFINDKGVAFIARMVFEGDTYGLDHCLTHDGKYGPLVEFYDRAYPFHKDERGDVLGQFVTRYYARTLLDNHQFMRGLCLDGGVERWSLDGQTYEYVIDWVDWQCEQQDMADQDWRCDP